MTKSSNCLADLANERERVLQGTLKNIESEADSDEVLVMVVLGTRERGKGENGERNRHGTE